MLFIPVFIWATGLTSTNKDAWQQSGIAATERIVIEAVSFNNTDSSPSLPEAQRNTQSCIIYVRNIGETAVTINNVIITSDTGVVQPYEKEPIPTTYPTTGPTFNPVPHELTTVIPLSTPLPDQSNMVSSIKGDLMELRLPRLSGTTSGTDGFRIIDGQMYTIKVFTTRGVSDTYQIVA